MPADLHCHTRLSDGSLGIEDLILLASRSGIDTIAITDHDCQAGTVRGKIIGKRHGVEVIPGVELSSYDPEHDMNISILCYLAENPNRLEGLCRKNSLARRKASQLMVVKASQRYPISSELVLKCASGSTNIYKQHIMHALMECGYTTDFYGDLHDELFDPKTSSSSRSIRSRKRSSMPSTKRAASLLSRTPAVPASSRSSTNSSRWASTASKSGPRKTPKNRPRRSSTMPRRTTCS